MNKTISTCDLQKLVNDHSYSTNILGFSVLHYIDPSDQETLKQIKQIRISLAKAIQNCPESLLTKIWNPSINYRFWSLVRSGVQRQLLSSEDTHLKRVSLDRFSSNNPSKIGKLNSSLILLLYCLPTGPTFKTVIQNLPEKFTLDF